MNDEYVTHRPCSTYVCEAVMLAGKWKYSSITSYPLLTLHHRRSLLRRNLVFENERTASKMLNTHTLSNNQTNTNEQ